MVWGGRREEGSGWGTYVYLWQIHFDIWQNEYNIAKLNKIKFKKKVEKLKKLYTYQKHLNRNLIKSLKLTSALQRTWERQNQGE